MTRQTDRTDCAESDADVIARALVPYGRMPRPETVAHLTDELITHGERLANRVRGDAVLRARMEGALRDWEGLLAAGPTGVVAPIANWSYARALARTVRVFREDGA